MRKNISCENKTKIKTTSSFNVTDAPKEPLERPGNTPLQNKVMFDVTQHLWRDKPVGVGNASF